MGTTLKPLPDPGPGALAGGVVLCTALAGLALALSPFVDAVVLAILLGAGLRAVWNPGPRWRPGIDFCARRVLEVAVALMGGLVGIEALGFLGPATLLAIAAIVSLSIAASYALARLFGLDARMALLVGCGNGICGNSAIAAAAPVIGARFEDVARAITFTAAFSLLAMAALPLLARSLGLDGRDYGILAGLTVYAVPQVLAVTLPAGAASTELGMVVKLARIMMLGPVLVALSLLSPARGRGGDGRHAPLVPWFVPVFFALAAARWVGLVPGPAVDFLKAGTGFLTLLAMAALGLGVALRDLGRGGIRLFAATGGAFLVLFVLALAYVWIIDGPGPVPA